MREPRPFDDTIYMGRIGPYDQSGSVANVDRVDVDAYMDCGPWEPFAARSKYDRGHMTAAEDCSQHDSLSFLAVDYGQLVQPTGTAR